VTKEQAKHLAFESARRSLEKQGISCGCANCEDRDRRNIAPALRIRLMNGFDNMPPHRVGFWRWLKGWYLDIRFRLRRYGYRLVVKFNYCGAYATALRYKPGESWLRGSDLRDGKVWRIPNVLYDIYCFEFNRERWRERVRTRV